MNDRVKKKGVTSPFEGEPRTVFWTDVQGKQRVRVFIHELTPRRAKAADSLSGLSAFALWCLSVYGLGSNEIESAGLWAAAMVSPLLTNPVLRFLFRKALRKQTVAEFTADRFRVNKLWGYKDYDRTLTHRFLMMKHDTAQEEREEQQLRVQRERTRGRVIAPKRYYDDSFHIIFDYMGQRFDVAEVFAQVRATAVTARLKACDQLMDTQLQMSEGEALNPGDQWGETPGRVPES